MTNINNLVKCEFSQQTYKIPVALTTINDPIYISEVSEKELTAERFITADELKKLALIKGVPAKRLELLKLPFSKRSRPTDLKDGEFAVPKKETSKERRMNPRTGRMKKFKTKQWLVTKIKPEERTLKNLPRFADKKPQVRFQDWLQLTRPTVSPNSKVHSVGRSPNGNWYGWSHRAIGEFGIGKEIKQGTIGNKFEYGEKIDKEYEKIARQSSYDIADKWRKDNCKFEPYVIKTDEEAMNHAIRFARDVS